MDRITKEQRSQNMRAIKSESALECLPKCFMGLMLRKHPKGVYGNPDFGNKTRKVVLFVDGCFWHGCPLHYKEPKSNVEFWRHKIERNMIRDKVVNAALKANGWRVIRVWECSMAEQWGSLV